MPGLDWTSRHPTGTRPRGWTKVDIGWFRMKVPQPNLSRSIVGRYIRELSLGKIRLRHQTWTSFFWVISATFQCLPIFPLCLGQFSKIFIAPARSRTSNSCRNGLLVLSWANGMVWNIFFLSIGKNDPNWLWFFPGIDTTNQKWRFGQALVVLKAVSWVRRHQDHQIFSGPLCIPTSKWLMTYIWHHPS